MTSSTATLDLNSTLIIPHSRIINQTLSLETLVINLDSGSYYSLEGTASIIWQLTVLGLPLKGVCKNLGNYCLGTPDDSFQPVRTLLEKFVSEELLVVGEPKPLPDQDMLAAMDKIAPASSIQYSEPSFSKFTDLQELLLADPIHELMEEE